MARPRKMLDLQEGDLTKARQTQMQTEESLIQTGTEQLKKTPSWLRDKIAKDEWKRLTEQFEKLSVISNLDLNNLGAYCNAYSFYLEATRELKGCPLTIEYTNKAGATNVIENPLIKIQLKYSDEMRRYSSLLGLTIDSRLKMSTLKLNETKKDVTDEYGDI